MKKLLSLSVVSLVSSSFGFIFLPLISSQLSLESFADYSFLYSVSAVLASVFLFGTNASYSLAMAERDDNYARQTLQLFVTVNVILGVGVLLLSTFFVVFRGWEWALVLLPFLVMGRSAFLATSHYFRVHKKTKYFAVYQLSTWLLAFCVPLFLSALFTDLSGVKFIAIMGGVIAVSGGAGAFIFKKKGYLKTPFVNPLSIPFFRFGLFAALHSLAASLITIIDRFILISFIEKEVFAVYSLAATLAGALSLVYSVLNQNLAPDFYAKMKSSNNDRNVLHRYLTFYLISILALFVIYQVSIGFIVSVFFPEKYFSAIDYARMISVATLLQGGYFFASSILMYLKLSDRLFKVTIGIGSLSVIGGLTGYHYFSILGVILNYIIIWLIYVIITYFMGLNALKNIKS